MRTLSLARSFLAALPLVSVVLVGCGSDGYTLAPVSGRVTVDGEPITGLRISFEPVGDAGKKNPGPDSIAITDTDGRYKLYTTETERRGAVVGKCRVRIWALPSNEPDKLLSDDRDPNYDPIAEVKAIKSQMRGRKAAVKKATRMIPLKYNDKTELTFDVPSAGSDKADFSISWN